MSKKIIIAGTLFALIVAGAWIYALLHGPSENSIDSFAEFESDRNTEYVPSTDPVITDVQIEESPAEKRLRQLTTNPVAGAVFAENGLYYVEQGTGHLRHINLVTGEEVLVSGTTIPGTYEASFSDEGSVVAITTTQDGAPKTIVATVPAFGSIGNLDGVALPKGASEINLKEKSGNVLYLVETSTGSIGYSYDIERKTSAELFSIPLRDVHIIWGDTLYAYTTPTETQTGYVYRIEGNELQYVTWGGIGLTSFAYNTDLVVTRKEGSVWSSSAVTPDGEIPLSLSLLPEKCTTAGEQLYCAAPQDMQEAKGFPDSWYKGAISFSDSLWRLNNSDFAVLLSDFLEESGREIDVLKIGINSLETYLYLVNKNDNTLWLYRL